MNKSKNLFFVSLLLATFLYADSDRFYDTNTVDVVDGVAVNVDPTDRNRSLIGEDTLPDTDFETGIHYSNRLGSVQTTVSKDDSGNIVFTDENGNAAYDTWDYENPKRNDPEAATFKAEFDAYVLDDNITHKRDNFGDLQVKSQSEAMRRGNTVKEDREVMLSKRNPLTTGPQFQARSMQKDPKLAGTNMESQDENMSVFYGSHVTLNVRDMQRDRIKEANLGAITEFYSLGLDGMIREMTSRLKASKVKCVLSRDLTPTFYCPISGKDGLRFPGSGGDQRNLNVAKVRNDCDTYCHTEPGILTCLDQAIPGLSGTDLNIPSPTIQVFPEIGTYPQVINFSANSKMPVKEITFKIKFPAPADFEQNQTLPANATSEETAVYNNKVSEAWENQLEKTPIMFKYSVLTRDPNALEFGYKMVADRSNVVVNSSQINVKLPIGQILQDVVIKIYKPYFTPKAGMAYAFAEEKLMYEGTGSRVEAYDYHAEYQSDKLYYCMARQIVYTPAQCSGGEVKAVVSGDAQFNYLCSSDEKKIGPEPDFGGFYDIQSCENACIEIKPCVASYSHYSAYGTEDTYLRSSASCLDDPDNTSCSDAVCEAMFRKTDSELRPITEYLIANDDTYIYTIRNSVLTEHARPKVDIGAELAANPDFEQLAINEEKDPAFLYMLENLTYNRNEYLIGADSPANVAYQITGKNDRTGIFGLIKPNSFDYNDGTKKLYAVMVTEHMYHPIAGVYTSGSAGIASVNENLLVKDITYSIKKNTNSLDSWEVFRRKEHAYIRIQETNAVVQEDGSIKYETKFVWVANEPYLKDNHAKYISATNTWLAVSKNAMAPSFTSQVFSATEDYFRYTMTTWIQRDLRHTPGLLIRDQVKISHDTDIEKLYNTPTFSHAHSSNPTNYYFFLTYSSTPLSYENLINKVEGSLASDIKVGSSKWGLYEMTNPNKYRSGMIKYDGEINNNIYVLKKGSPGSETISVNWEPSVKEKGKKVFKFIFLFDETETDVFDLSSYTN